MEIYRTRLEYLRRKRDMKRQKQLEKELGKEEVKNNGRLSKRYRKKNK